jgi:multidrug resistance protein MdtO
MAARDRIRRWQASLRSFYLLEAPLLQFRISGNIASKAQLFTVFEDDFRFECSRIFQQIADSLESQNANRSFMASVAVSLEHRVKNVQPGSEAEFSERERAMARLVHFIAQLVERLRVEVASEGLYDVLPASAPRQAGYENA